MFTMSNAAGQSVSVGSPRELQYWAGLGYVVQGATFDAAMDALTGINRDYFTPNPVSNGVVADTAVAALIANGQSATGGALRAALVPFWAPNETVTAGKVRMTADGHTIVRNSNGTTRPTYDGTEAALWTVVSGGGGTSYTDEQVMDLIGSTIVAGAGITKTVDDAGNTVTLTATGAAGTAALTPTATKTAAYTAAVGELAVMNVAAGATALTLPTAPADKAQVGFRAVGATTAVPLVVSRGGSDTIGDAGATSISLPLSGEVTIYQYQASATRWLPVSNVKPLAALDGRYATTTALAALPRGELAYAETNVDYAVTTSSAAVPGLDLTLTVADRPVMVTAFIPSLTASAATFLSLTLYDVTSSAERQRVVATVPATGAYGTLGSISFRLPAGAGAKRYQVRAQGGATGITLKNSLDVAFIQALEV